MTSLLGSTPCPSLELTWLGRYRGVPVSAERIRVPTKVCQLNNLFFVFKNIMGMTVFHKIFASDAWTAHSHFV